jgi:hypothetical protein
VLQVHRGFALAVNDIVKPNKKTITADNKSCLNAPLINPISQCSTLAILADKMQKKAGVNI